VEGDGSCVTASATSRNFNPSVSVFRGNQCGELTCISQNEEYSSNGASWQSEIGETYFVVIGARYGRSGDFFLEIEVRDDVCGLCGPVSYIEVVLFLNLAIVFFSSYI
jgi:hypothetical protein